MFAENTKPHILPSGAQRLLLHVCCAPCSCGILQLLLAQNIETTIFFYNPNIHPIEEYKRRKEEVIQYATKIGIPFVDADYDVETWIKVTKGHENDPERGVRCSKCFALRLERTAAYASEHGFPVIATSLTASRWKDYDQVTQAGQFSVVHFPNVVYCEYNWRKGDVPLQASIISRSEQFYRQKYCGCIYSFR